MTNTQELIKPRFQLNLEVVMTRTLGVWFLLVGFLAAALFAAEADGGPSRFPQGLRGEVHGPSFREPTGKARAGHRFWERLGCVGHTRQSTTLPLRLDHRDGDGERLEGFARDALGR